MPHEPMRLVIVTLLPGQVIMGACGGCGAPLAFEPADCVVRVERCKATKCVRAAEVVSRQTQAARAVRA